MKNPLARYAIAVSLLTVPLLPAGATELITNGNFETGTFAGWTTVLQFASAGDFFVGTPGLPTPRNGLSTQSAGGLPHGSFYAVTDQGGIGANALLQDFLVGAGSTSVILSFDLFVNSYGTPAVNPAGLDYNAAPNQHGRVDLLTSTATPFSTSIGVLRNFYIGSDPIVGGPNPFIHYSFDITSLVGTGGSFQLRFAEVDKRSYFNLGVDNVSISAITTAVPEPESLLLSGLGVAMLAVQRRRGKQTR